MLPLEVKVDVIKVRLPAEREALSDVAHRNDHVLVLYDSLYVFYISIDELLVELNVLQPRSHIHHMKHAIRDVMI